ncbi:hypothetical protein NDU88_000990 [Pleurodeles waltl]|uniref:TNFR-Cys domain-containing protein n=1 Tax=Pleurodeles waltl TaxID=8319 RepID=A0AAV7P441_PLEWA|nr:hypothetical protein NDU88_000990 [Pleurodeles waltl]
MAAYRLLILDALLLVLWVQASTGPAVLEKTEAPYSSDRRGCNATANEYLYEGRCCRQCPPGQFAQSKCSPVQNTKCVPCLPGSYMDVWNSYYTCLPCRTHCNTDRYLVETSKCLSDRPRNCSCRNGYTCSRDEDGQCEECIPLVGSTVTATRLVTIAADCRIEEVFNATSGRCEDFIQCEGARFGGLICNDHMQTSYSVFHSCTCPLQQSFSCRFEGVPPECPMYLPTAGASVTLNSLSQERHGCCNTCSTSASHTIAHPTRGTLEETGNAAIGPLHIYSPGAVYVGYINNVQQRAPPDLVPIEDTLGLLPGLGATEEELQYPRQEQSQSGEKESPTLAELSGQLYSDASNPQQEIDDCGKWGDAVSAEEVSRAEGPDAAGMQEEEAGPESQCCLDLQKERCPCGYWGLSVPLQEETLLESLGVLVHQQAMSGQEHFVDLRYQAGGLEHRGNPQYQKEKHKCWERGLPSEEEE